MINEKEIGKTRSEVVAWCRHLPGRAEGSPGKNSGPQAKREDTGPTEIGVERGNCMQLARERVQWLVLVLSVLNLVSLY